jgi:hypothetical protein
VGTVVGIENVREPVEPAGRVDAAAIVFKIDPEELINSTLTFPLAFDCVH